jgi:hypothetical protein
VKCIKEMYDGITFCVKCGENEATAFTAEERQVTQSCSLSPHLFNIFIDDIIDYIVKNKIHTHTSNSNDNNSRIAICR